MMPIINNRFTSDDAERFTCPLCGTQFKVSELRDPLSVKEAGISGMCQSCQDSVFDSPEAA